MELWEHKWKEFLNVEDLGRDEETEEFPHGEEIYKRLPQFLYHVTPKSTFRKISKQGYLGYKYREHDDVLDSRDWQKSGWGVFFGTNPETCESYMSSTIDRNQPLVCLKVDKGKLDPEKFYVDDDIAGSYLDFDDMDMEDISIFYADKVPFSDISVVSLDEKPDFSSYSNSRESRVTTLKRSTEFVEEKIQQCFKSYLKFQYPTRGGVDVDSPLVLINFTLLGGKIKCRGFRVEFNKATKQYEIVAYLNDRYESVYGKVREELQKIFTPFCSSVKSAVYPADYSRLEWDKEHYY